MPNSAPTLTSRLLFVGEFQQLRRKEAEFLRDEHIRKHLHPDVIQIHLVVVQFAAVGDGLFEGDDPALQLLERLVALQLRIVLGDCEQPADAGPQLLLRRADGGDIARGAGLIDRRPRPHDFLERFLLELHVAFAGFHQFRQLVVPLLQQHVDVRPRDLDVLAQRDQPVVDADEIDDQGEAQGEDHDESDHRGTPCASYGPAQYIIGFFTSLSTEFTVSDQAFDLISVGGGSGGLACAQRAAEFGAKAAVIEPHRLGGTCVNVGCVPKKVMWNAASVALSLADADDYGFHVTVGDSDWAALKRKRDAYVLRLNGIYERNLAAKGVAYVRGAARFLDKNTVEVNGERLTARHIVIATGGRPTLPTLPGAEYGITSDGFFELEQRPKRVAVVGSGYVACELAGAFHELGTQVELFIRKDHLLTSFDVMLGKSSDARDARAGHRRSPPCRACRRCARRRACKHFDGGGRPRIPGFRLPVVGGGALRQRGRPRSWQGWHRGR